MFFNLAGPRIRLQRRIRKTPLWSNARWICGMGIGVVIGRYELAGGEMSGADFGGIAVISGEVKALVAVEAWSPRDGEGFEIVLRAVTGVEVLFVINVGAFVGVESSFGVAFGCEEGLCYFFGAFCA